MWHIYENQHKVFDAPTWSCALNLHKLACGLYDAQVYITDDESNILVSKRGHKTPY